jgi:hypothetical protein
MPGSGQSHGLSTRLNLKNSDLFGNRKKIAVDFGPRARVVYMCLYKPAIPTKRKEDLKDAENFISVLRHSGRSKLNAAAATPP